MRDQDVFDTVGYVRSATVSWRQFGALVAGAAILSLLPAMADAAPVTGSAVEIRTPDGTCDA